MSRNNELREYRNTENRIITLVEWDGAETDLIRVKIYIDDRFSGELHFHGLYFQSLLKLLQPREIQELIEICPWCAGEQPMEKINVNRYVCPKCGEEIVLCVSLRS